MLGFLKELSPLNFIFSPILSAFTVLFGALLGVGAFLKREQIGELIHNPQFSLLASGVVFLLIGIFLIFKKHGSSWIGRLANAFIVAAFIDLVIFAAIYKGFLVA